MRAVVKYGSKAGEVELREVEAPRTERGEVLMEVKAASVCGSDLHMWHHRFDFPVQIPVILGHEFCGVVKEIGEGVTGFTPGQHVVSETAAFVCGRCVYCRSGRYHLCRHRKGFGYGTDGAFAEFVAVRAELLHPLPETIPFSHAALFEPLCVGYNALMMQSRVNAGDTVAVIGPGAIGLFALQLAELMGGRRVLVVGLPKDAKRLEVAQQLGADMVAVEGRDDARQVVELIDDGYGMDVVIEAAGAPEALKLALDIARPDGLIVKLGLDPSPIGFSLDALAFKSVTLQGAFSHTYSTWERAIALVAERKIAMGPLVSRIYKLEEWEDAFKDSDSGEVVKAVLQP